ncbi:MAG: hypothetical protein J6M31_02975 [Bacteroidales bacterium]|nr:hypothetical protein [Bacteroidales bacterium]
MKTLLFILSLLLSLFSGGKNKTEAVAASDDGVYCVAEASSPDTQADYSLNRELCISAAQGQTFAGDGGSNSVSIRTTNTGRRTSPQNRFTFRVIKGGKVIDNNRTHPFLTPVFVPLSGTPISERYLFSICRLRL